MRQDEQGRWVSDDGQWIWDGNAWQPREASGVAPAAPAAAWADPDATQIHPSTAVGPGAGQRRDDGYIGGSGHSSAQVPATGGAADDSSVTRIVPGGSEAAAGQGVGGGPISPSEAGAHVADTSRLESRPEPGAPGVAATAAWQPDFSDEDDYAAGNYAAGNYAAGNYAAGGQGGQGGQGGGGYGGSGAGAGVAGEPAGYPAGGYGTAPYGAAGYGAAHGAVGYDPGPAQAGQPVPAAPYSDGVPAAGGPVVPGQPGGFAPSQYAGGPWPPPGGPAGRRTRRGRPAWLIPLIAALVVIGIAVGVFFLLRSDDKSSSTSSPAQQTGPAVTAPSAATGLPTPAESSLPTSLPSSTALPSVSPSLPGTFPAATEQGFMNDCVSGGNQAYCACALTALENEFTPDEYLTFEQQYSSGDPTARAKLQQIKDSCRSQLPSG